MHEILLSNVIKDIKAEEENPNEICIDASSSYEKKMIRIDGFAKKET